MKDNWKIGVLACTSIVCVFVFAICVGLAWPDVEKVSECVLVRPLEGASGFITYPGMYSVSYRGTTKGTGEVCVESVMVTESEYERMMYGEERRDLIAQD